MSETWKPIPQQPLYDVSSTGNVRKWIDNYHNVLDEPIMLSPHNYRGRDRVSIIRDGKRRTFCVDRLVLKSFYGEGQESCECKHLDGNNANNDVENLEWSYMGKEEDGGSERMLHEIMEQREEIAKLQMEHEVNKRAFGRAY